MRLHFLLVHFARYPSSRAVNAVSGDIGAPVCGALVGVFEVTKLLASKPSLPHIVDLILDSRPIARMADSRWIDEDSASLNVVGGCLGEHWRQAVGMNDRRPGVVRDEATGDTSEELPLAIEPLADCLSGLAERGPHEHMTTEAERDDEHPELPLLARHRIHLDPWAGPMTLQKTQFSGPMTLQNLVIPPREVAP